MLWTDRDDEKNAFQKLEPLGRGVAFLIGPENIFLSSGQTWKS